MLGISKRVPGSKVEDTLHLGVGEPYRVLILTLWQLHVKPLRGRITRLNTRPETIPPETNQAHKHANNAITWAFFRWWGDSAGANMGLYDVYERTEEPKGASKIASSSSASGRSSSFAESPGSNLLGSSTHQRTSIAGLMTSSRWYLRCLARWRLRLTDVGFSRHGTCKCCTCRAKKSSDRKLESLVHDFAYKS